MIFYQLIYQHSTLFNVCAVNVTSLFKLSLFYLEMQIPKRLLKFVDVGRRSIKLVKSVFGKQLYYKAGF